MQLDEDQEAMDSDYYGIWPTIIGLLMAAVLIWFMFAYADGFS